MTGPAVPPGGEELREAIARAMCDTDAGEIGYSWDELLIGEPTPYSGIADAYRRCANAVLALPAVRDALAAQEKLRRVEALAERLRQLIDGYQVPAGAPLATQLDDLRAALLGSET